MTIPGLGDGAEAVHCEACSRLLKATASVRDRLGPDCRRRLHPPPPRRTVGRAKIPRQPGPTLLDLLPTDEGEPDDDEPDDSCDGWDR